MVGDRSGRAVTESRQHVDLANDGSLGLGSAAGDIPVILGAFEDVVRLGLSVALRTDPRLHIVSTQAAQLTIEAFAQRYEPCIAVVASGVAQRPHGLADLLTRHPGLRVVVLALRPTRALRQKLLACGAMACMPLHTESEELCDAIRRAAVGRRSGGLGLNATERGRLNIAGLSARERDVLELLPWLRDTEIAKQLYISKPTVATHARHVYQKLGISGRTELREIINFAPRTGISDDDRRQQVG